MCGGACCVGAKIRYVRELVGGNRKRRNVGDEIVSGILSIQQIEEFHERPHRDTFAPTKLPADAEIDLREGSSSKLIEGGLDSIDDGAVVGVQPVAIDILRRGQSEKSRAFVGSDGSTGTVMELM